MTLPSPRCWPLEGGPRSTLGPVVLCQHHNRFAFLGWSVLCVMQPQRHAFGVTVILLFRL